LISWRWPQARGVTWAMRRRSARDGTSAA
jgi:hypothetical protein